MGQVIITDATNWNIHRRTIYDIRHNRDMAEEIKLRKYQKVIDDVEADLDKWEADAIAEIQKIRAEYERLQVIAQQHIDGTF